MGATNCPETPRQKMIGMMYLFLTAMLALNVSKDILNAFVIVNEGLNKTNTNFTLRNGFTYDAFTNAKSNDPKKVAPYYDAAFSAKKLSSDMVEYIKGLKVDIIMQTDAKPKDEALKAEEDMSLFENKENRDVPNLIMLGTSEDGSQGKARELKNKLIDLKKQLFDLLNNPKIIFADKDVTIKGLGELGINTSDDKNFDPDKPEEKHWETKLFSEIPCAATITLLTQIQNQVKNAEATVIQTLLGGIGATDFKFDTVAPRVIPKSNYLISGDKYEADLFVAAFSSTDTASKVLIGEGYDSINHKLTGTVQTLNVQRGIGKYIVDAGVGSHSYSAIIKVFNPSTGLFKESPVRSNGKYSIEYTVAPPMAVVSPTKMNVLYVGVDNPIEISVPGFRDDQISANCSGGSLSKAGKGGWIARVTKTGKCNISVSVKDDKGGSRSMGSKEFRMKRIPDPVPTVAKLKGGQIAKGMLQAQQGVEATLEGFDFDLKFTIASFTVSATLDGGFNEEATSPNNRFTPQQMAIFGKLKKGKKVYIENVKCRKPDGTVVPLGSISFKIN
jgi:gliding motility-associated protein GldM